MAGMRPIPGLAAALTVVACAYACDGDPGASGAGGVATAAGAGGGSVGGGGAGGSPVVQDLVEVSHPRELRGAWVATVSNINFPSVPGLSPSEQQAELDAIVEACAEYNLNAIVFQVRPECDALYESALEPWSRFLMGTQGEDPGYDPLAYLIEKAHARAIEVHAWFNPYRAKVSSSSKAVLPHLSVEHPELAYPYGTALWMDPGADVVRDKAIEVILDVVTRYDVDGVHLDDYFYPYPIDGQTFPDGATYGAYKSGGGTLDLGDWRRDNVNRMVEELGQRIPEKKSWVRWGISPFGIYRPGMPRGITGLDQYASLYADPKKWIEEGWVDYLAPQLYWPTTQTAQAYGKLVPWWGDLTGGDRYIFIGNFLSKAGESGWSVDELVDQVQIGRDHRDQNVMGNVFFQVQALLADQQGVATAYKAKFYQQAVLTPVIAAMRGVKVHEPLVSIEGTTATLENTETAPLRAWVVYKAAGEAFELDRIEPADKTTIELAKGVWAISAATRFGGESPGVRVEVE